MTTAALGGLTPLGLPSNFALSLSSIVLDATTDYICFVVRAPATGTIDKVFVRLSTTTLVGTFSCRIYNLDSAGDPDTASVYGSCVQSDYSATGTDDGTIIEFGSLACSATINDDIAVFFWFSSISSGTSASINYQSSSIWPVNCLPYLVSRTTGSGAGTHGGLGGGIAIEYSGGVYHDFGLTPPGAVVTVAVDNDSSIRRAGNRFILEAPITVYGAWIFVENDFDTTTVKLYDIDSTTSLGSTTLVVARRNGTAGGMYYVYFPTPVNLVANTATAYRIVIETSSTTTNAAVLRGYSCTPAHLAQCPMGVEWYSITHNGTAWSADDTQRLSIGLLASKIDDGTGFGRASFNLGI